MCICSCVATYFLKKASISSLNIILCFSNILRKSSWEKDDTMVEASFVTEAVADVVLESNYFCLGDILLFLLSVLGNKTPLSMS